MDWQVDYRVECARREWNCRYWAAHPEKLPLLMLYYSTRPVEFIEDWCVTYDPRRDGAKYVPFILFPRQREFIQFLYELYLDGESGLVEKCRDMGASWLCICFAVWMWIFNDGASLGFGSRKEQLVDRIGDPDSIFEKMRIIIRFLPSFLMPIGFNPRLHMTYLKLINPLNGNTIKGEAGDNIGRGGRSTMYLKDESAHYEHSEKIEAALGNNTDIQVDISSVNGTGNVFYRRRFAKTSQIWQPGVKLPPGITRIFIMDWRDDPRKTQQWYDERRAKAEAEGLLHLFAQETDRDYTGSVEKVIIRQEWVKAAIDAHIKLGFGEDGDNAMACDIADGGGDRNSYAGRKGVILRHADHWGGEAGEAAKIAIPVAVEHGYRELYYDSIGVGAGFKAAANNLIEAGAVPNSLRIMPWNAAAAPLDPESHIIPGDEKSPTNETQYANLKAQAWFRARNRFYKTYRAVVHGETYDPSELISLDSTIPLIHEISIQLSQAVYKYSMNGKTMVDKTPEGTTSPNLADGVIMAYCPTRAVSIFDAM